MTYNEQNEWKEIEKTLPERYRFNEKYKPTEEWWKWKEHNVHLDTFRNPDSKAKLILLHGVGTNGRQLSLITGLPQFKNGYEVIAIDMPTYGLTQVKNRNNVTYDDWIQLANDYINYELSKDNRPIFLYGLSAGGMETYDVAAKNRKVKGIIGMTFLDQLDMNVRDTTSNNIFMSRIGVPLLKFSKKIGLGKFTLKMSFASKMSALCNNKETMKIFMKDKTSAGNSASINFLESYMYHKLITPPEEFEVCPILLTQPESDKWTPLELSEPFLSKIKKVNVKTVILKNGGHYPVEEEALDTMNSEIDSFIKNIL